MTHVTGSFCSDLSFDATTANSTAFGIVCTLSFVLCSISAVEFNQSAIVRLDFCLKFPLQGVCAITACALEELRRHSCPTTQWSSAVDSKNTMDKVDYQ